MRKVAAKAIIAINPVAKNRFRLSAFPASVPII
jgi:hypothetical protein